MRASLTTGILSPVRWMFVVVVVGCSGPSSAPPDADAGDVDASVAASLEVEVLTVQRGAPVAGEISDDRHRIGALTVGLDRLEWKTDVREELYVEQGRAVDLLERTTIEAMELPPGRYSEVELELREGPWGASVSAMIDDESVEITEELGLDARCDGPLELRVGEEARVTLEIDGDRLLELLRDAEGEDVVGALRDALSEALRLICP